MNKLSADDLEYAPCGFLIFADTGAITGVNSTLTELLGYGHKDEAIGKNIETLFTIAGRIFYQTHFFPLIKLQGKASEIFFFLRTKKGEDLPVICNVIRKERDGVYSNHCIILPITERGKYEQQLLDARRDAEDALKKNIDLIAAKKEVEEHSIELDRQVSNLKQINNDISQFSKVISHDLQEPIRKIAVFADRVVMEAQNMLPEETLNKFVKINKECRRLRHLAANLERFISLNIRTENMALTDLDAVLQAAWQKTHKLYDVEVLFAAEPLPVIEAYRPQAELLFTYILDNCMKYRDPARPLAITIECAVVQQNSFRTTQGKYRYIDFVKIMIADNGLGFDTRDKNVVFKLKNEMSSNNIGFGLPFCKKIADNHYGSISASSTPGKGTLITLLLPVRQSL